MCGCVLPKHAPPRLTSHSPPLFLGCVVNVTVYVPRGRRNEDLFAYVENGFEAFPVIGDDRRAAGRGFEKAYAGRIPGFNHIGPGDVQRESLSVVKITMCFRREVLDALDVTRPSDIIGILRAGDNKPSVFPESGSPD